MNLESIDHIVWAVPDFNAGVEQLSDLLGCKPQPGGVHPGRGTRNALLKIGAKQYLEILGPDPAQAVDNCWMGLGLIAAPRITRWCLRSARWADDLQALKNHQAALAEVGKGERQRPDGSLLQWQMSYPMAQPAIELAPFLIQWGAAHPCESLTMECQLASIHFTSPNAILYNSLFTQLESPYEVAESEQDTIRIVLDTPNGRVELS